MTTITETVDDRDAEIARLKAEIAAGKAADKAADVSDEREVKAGSKEGLSTSDAAKYEPEEAKEPEYYVWLANGAVKRCKETDLPNGSSAPFGHWQSDDKLFEIVNVYPVEETVK